MGKEPEMRILCKVTFSFLIGFAFTNLTSLLCFSQTTWCVPGDFPTIQGALSDPSVISGDKVIVRAGTYVENVDFLGKEIKLKSEDGPGCTVIDGSGQFLSVVSIKSGEGRGAVLQGFTLTNGWGTLYIDGNRWGGGIYCQNSSPAIMNNIIINNKMSHIGGGIAGLSSGNPLIKDNEICYNSAGGGGGLVFRLGCSCLVEGNYIHDNHSDWSGGGITVRWETYDSIIRNNRIENNYAGSDGGGIYIGANTASYIYNNVIIGNVSDMKAKSGGGGGICLWNCYEISSYVYNNYIANNICHRNNDGGGGGGIYSRYDNSFIYNNTITGNESIRGGGLFVLSFSHIIPRISNSIIWGNKANWGPDIGLCEKTGSDVIVEYSNVTRGWQGTGNIHADPMFVDPSNGDYHLQYLSPCRDMGSTNAPYLPDYDFEGDPRNSGDDVDMGADEFHPHLYCMGAATPSGTILAKFVGLPGTTINGVVLGVNILDPPLPCEYGLWYMDDPMEFILGLGTIPACGVADFPGIIPSTPPAPYTVYLQGVIDFGLTNLCPVNVQ